MKSQISYNRLKKQYNDIIAFEDYIEDIEEVQEKIIFNTYDLAVVDDKLWWKEEVVELFKSKGIEVIIFQGDFEEVEKQIEQFIKTDDTKEELPVDDNSTDSKGSNVFEQKIQERIVEKPVKIKVPVYKDVYKGIKNQLIAIFGLYKGAGATFITLNLAKALADYKVSTAVIEPPIDMPYIFDTIGLEARLDITEEKESLQFYSFPHAISNNEKVQRDKATIEDGIMWFIPDPRKELIKEWDYYKMMKLLYASRKASITLVDGGSNMLHESFNQTLSEMDKILVVIDCMPTEIMQNIDTLDKLIDMKNEGYPIEFVFNKWNEGIDKDSLLKDINVNPLMYVPFIDVSLVYKAIYSCQIPYSIDAVKNKLEKPFSRIVRDLVPIDLLKDKHKTENRKNSIFAKLLFRKGDK